jgi:tetratricopeptide (TPR) repeat protein
LSKAKNKAKNRPAASQQKQTAQADIAQVQSLLGQFHLVAQALHNSADQGQVEVALETITGEAAPVQMALIKALAKERSADAADVLRALNELSPVKDIRKEARRAMIQLEGARVQSSWTPPVERKSPLDVFQALANPPRFWKGLVTDTRSSGEVSLILLWEQGEEYREVRLLGFLLDFWRMGVKDAFTQTDSKRSIEKFIVTINAESNFRSCSLAKGKHLIEEALAVNKKHHTQPHSGYSMNLSLINRLIMEAEDIGEETEEDQLPEAPHEEDFAIARSYQDIGPDSAPSEVALGFLEAWFDEDFEFAYDLLAKDSSLREGLTKREWAAKRRQWADKAHPDNFQNSFIKEHESRAGTSGLWLPRPLKRGKEAVRDVEIGWSLEMADVALADTLPELPRASLVYKETGKHWFWTSYSLVVEQNRLRIQSMVDETARAQSLSIDELQKQIDEHTRQAQEIAQSLPPDSVDAVLYATDIAWHLLSSIYYQDALIKKSPFEREGYEVAAAKSYTLGQHERAVVYYEDILAHFPEKRAQTLLLAASSKLDIAEEIAIEADATEDEEETLTDLEVGVHGRVVEADNGRGAVDDKELEKLKERAQHLMKEAEAQVRESLKLEDTVNGHMILADILESKGDARAYNEAIKQMEQALKLNQDNETLVSIVHHLAETLFRHRQYKDALKHFQRLAELDPNYSCVWNHLGETYEKLNQLKKAEESYLKSIELHPDNESFYISLGDFYVQQRRYQEARELLEQGLINLPDSANLIALLASVFFNTGETDRAEEMLNEAEEVDPNAPLLHYFRQAIAALQQKQP